MSKYPLQPGVAWTDAQLAEWKAIRARGFRRFAIRFGLTFFIPTAVVLVIMLVIARAMDKPPDWLWTTPIMILPPLPFLTAFISYFLASILWRDFEARYNETLTMRGLNESASHSTESTAEKCDQPKSSVV